MSSWSTLLLGLGIAGMAGELAAQSQEHPQVTVVPTVAFGGMQRNGPQLYAGGQLRVGINRYLVGVAQASRWTTIAACADRAEGDGCASGYNADLGIDLHGSSPQSVRPYVGVGVGAMSARQTATALNTRVGLDLGKEDGLSFHVEARAQRALGPLDASAGMVTVGLAFGL